MFQTQHTITATGIRWRLPRTRSTTRAATAWQTTALTSQVGRLWRPPAQAAERALRHLQEAPAPTKQITLLRICTWLDSLKCSFYSTITKIIIINDNNEEEKKKTDN